VGALLEKGQVEGVRSLEFYIHLNPIRIHRFKNADIRKKAGHLKKYPWSSFAGYCYLRKRNPRFDCIFRLMPTTISD
jgi:hypothetical protein